jgi:hypothetical protein
VFLKLKVQWCGRFISLLSGKTFRFMRIERPDGKEVGYVQKLRGICGIFGIKRMEES